MNVWCAAEDETSTICHLPFGRRRVSLTAQHRSGPFRVAPAARKRHTSSCFTEQVAASFQLLRRHYPEVIGGN